MTVLHHWGDMDNKGSGDSAFFIVPVPWFIRDPDSQFSMGWDLVSVLFLIYVCITVPIRACFPPNIDGNRDYSNVLSLSWTVDTITDLYFIADLIMNFFTAFPNPHDGTPVIDRRSIAVHYAQGWFLIDFVSSIPIQYILMLLEKASTTGDREMDLRFLKSIRLLRLSKMLRLVRLKKLMQKYEKLAAVQEYGNLAMVLFVIFGVAHVLACMWYTVGSNDEQLQGIERIGWVNSEWSPSNDTRVSLWTRYTAAIYNVFNPLDRSSETEAERRFAVFGHVILIMVDGAVAGVMSALMISMQGHEREYNERITIAKDWMKEHKIPKSRSEPALEYFRTFYKSSVATEEAAILNAMTPAMKIEFATFLYSKFVANVPLFHGLSPGIIRALCDCVEPTFAVRQQVIYHEGSTGREMYIVISGELEISAAGTRLGFISDGGFFGEVPILEDTAVSDPSPRSPFPSVHSSIWNF